MDVFGEIYNRAWRRNFGFVPYDKADLDQYALEMQLVFDQDWFMVAEVGDEPIAIAITIPDINQVLRRMNGQLLPVRLVALPAAQQDDRPGPRRVPGRQAQVPAHGRGGGAVRGALRRLRRATS